MAAENDKRTLSRALAGGCQLATVHAHVFSLTIMFKTTHYWCKKTNAAAMLVDETFLGKWNSVFMPFITWLKSIYGMVRLLLLSSIISAPVFVDATTPAADSTTTKFNKRRAEWKEKTTQTRLEIMRIGQTREVIPPKIQQRQNSIRLPSKKCQ